MTGNTTPREKARAVFLAALMVLSVFAMTAAFTGSAAADVTGFNNGSVANSGNVVDTGAQVTHDPVSTNYTVDANGTVDVNFTLDNGAEYVNFDGVTLSSTDSNISNEGFSVNGTGAIVGTVNVTNLAAASTDIQVSVDGAVVEYPSAGDTTVTFQSTANQNTSTALTGPNTLGTVTTYSTGNGTVYVDVRDADSTEPLGDATVEIYQDNVDPALNDPFRVLETPSEDEAGTGTVAFEDLEIGNDSNNRTQWTVRAEANETYYESDFTVGELYEPGQTEDTVTLNLKSELDAQNLEIIRWNEETDEPILSDEGSLLADGMSSTNTSFAVVTQNQLDEGVSGTLGVDLDISQNAFDIDGTQQGASVGDFWDNEALNRTASVTIDGSDTVDIGEDYQSIDKGKVSYATFEVTSDNATRDWLEANSLDPIADQPFDATAVNDSGTTLSDSANVSYFLKGEKATQHQVTGTDGAPLENVSVWVAYSGGSQELETVSNIEDESGDAFLVSETNENGIAVIDGIIGSANTSSPTFNVYVKSSGYNVFNSSTAMTSNGDVLASATGIQTDYFVADYEVNNTVAGDEGSGEDDVYSHVLRQTPLAYDLNVTVADADENFVKSTRMPDTESRQVKIEVDSGEVGEDVEDFTPAEGEEINLELINDSGVANLADTTVTTNDQGVAYTTIEGESTQTGVVNITASILNSDNTEYRTDASTDSINEVGDQAQVEVYTTGNIEGDVIDANQEGVPGATVDLEVENDTGAYVSFENRSVVTGSDGSFTFQNVPTGDNYRVVATFTDNEGNEYTGYNQGQLEDLPGGTTTAGISLEALKLDEVPDGNVGFQDVLDTISDYNDGNASFEDVLDAIESYNQDN